MRAWDRFVLTLYGVELGGSVVVWGMFLGCCWFMFFVDFICVCNCLWWSAWFLARWVGVVVGGHEGFLLVAGVMLLGVICVGVSSCEGWIGCRGGHSQFGCVV